MSLRLWKHHQLSFSGFFPLPILDKLTCFVILALKGVVKSSEPQTPREEASTALKTILLQSFHSLCRVVVV